ncbi:unnamed protein product [Periconia digitata]|uniref:Uncharacterized protein n=1 Tax=Periconia digitata TaxID=1303443 RepID=A0A9W4XHV7_9PLEO|nr:unnamed protein product [Periconia digitata]
MPRLKNALTPQPITTNTMRRTSTLKRFFKPRKSSAAASLKSEDTMAHSSPDKSLATWIPPSRATTNRQSQRMRRRGIARFRHRICSSTQSSEFRG